MPRLSEEMNAQAGTRDVEPMDEIRLQAIVDEEVHSSVGYVGGETSESRARAMEFYYGEPFGNETEGRSQFVSTDVQDVIESMMPDFIEIFAGGEEVGKFEANGEADIEDRAIEEAQAEQATQYANYIWNVDNDGYGNSFDAIKDALLQKIGVFKITWDETEKETRHTLENVNDLMLVEIGNDPEIEILGSEENEDGTVDLDIIRTRSDGRVKVEVLPPEEFLIGRRSTALDEDTDFSCHVYQTTPSELKERGFDAEEVDGIPSGGVLEDSEERITRFNQDDEWPFDDESLDPAGRSIWVHECYMKVDYDGDGITEMVMVHAAGPGLRLLTDPSSGEKVTEVDDHPFEAITPIRMPHKFFGRSVSELVEDIQLIKSTVIREWLNNQYNLNNNRAAISRKVDLDDFLTIRPGGTVRVDTDSPDVAGHIVPLQSSSLGGYALNMLSYIDGVREARTGIPQQDQGMDPSKLHDTAAGLNIIMARAQKRTLLIARNFAHGYARAFRKILRLVVERQDRARVIKIRGEYVEMDPRSWNAEMDFTLQVGLGYGTQEQKAQSAGNLLSIQEKLISAQGGMNGPYVEWKHVFNSLKQILPTLGYKGAESYFNEPEVAQRIRLPERPNPDMEKLKMEGQFKQMDLQTKQAESQMKAQEMQEKVALAQQESQAKVLEIQTNMQLAVKEMELKTAEAMQKMQLERELAEAKIGAMVREADAKANLKMAEIQVNAEVKRQANTEAAQSNATVAHENRQSSESASQTAGAVSEAANTVQQIGQDVAQLGQRMEGAISEMAEAIATLAKPKQVVRDAEDKIIGVKPMEGSA